MRYDSPFTAVASCRRAIARTNPLFYLTGQLNELEQKGTCFKLRVLEDEHAPVCTFDGKKGIYLASNCSAADTGGY